MGLGVIGRGRRIWPSKRGEGAAGRAGSAVAVAAAVVGILLFVLTGSTTSIPGSARRPGVSLAGISPRADRVARPGRRRLAAGAVEERAVDRLLSYTSYVERGSSRRREVALTFDDGLGPATPRILAILRKTHTPATFFLIGRSVRSYPWLVAAEAREGFVVGDHTETHPFMSGLTRSAQAAELRQAADDIQRAHGRYPRLFRPPYGVFDKATLAVLRARRMLMVLWSVDTKDYSQPGVNKIVCTTVSGAQPGAIILMHDGGGNRAQTVAALPRIILRLRRRGFRLVSIPQMISDDPPPRDQPPPHEL